eukprot:6210874-Pleurochrysis_carterae.AAC.2
MSRLLVAFPGCKRGDGPLQLHYDSLHCSVRIILVTDVIHTTILQELSSLTIANGNQRKTQTKIYEIAGNNICGSRTDQTLKENTARRPTKQCDTQSRKGQGGSNFPWTVRASKSAKRRARLLEMCVHIHRNKCE